MSDLTSLGILAAAFLVVLVVLAFRKAGAVQRAGRSYQLALYELRRRPNDPDLKTLALQKGRVYSNLARDSSGVTIHDELAIMNDLQSACAASSQIAATRLDGGSTIGRKLLELQELKDAGLISEDEYADKRNEIIGNL